MNFENKFPTSWLVSQLDGNLHLLFILIVLPYLYTQDQSVINSEKQSPGASSSSPFWLVFVSQLSL